MNEKLYEAFNYLKDAGEDDLAAALTDVDDELAKAKEPPECRYCGTNDMVKIEYFCEACDREVE